MFNNISIFEWLGFFLGGVFSGTGIELIKFIANNRKASHDKEKVINLLWHELDFNVRLCESMIESVKKRPQGVIPFNKFENKWMQVYLDKYANFDSEENQETYSKFLWINQTYSVIEALYREQSNYRIYGSVTGQLVTNFIAKNKKTRSIGTEIYKDYLKNTNKNIADMCKNLKIDLLKTPFSSSDYMCLKYGGFTDEEIGDKVISLSDYERAVGS